MPGPDLYHEARVALPHLIEIRRAIHRHPELGLETEETARLVEQELDRLGIPHRRFAQTGVAGYLGQDRPGLALILRGDLDALPIQEDNDLPFKSEIPGRMHACGHDIHTTSVLGAAALLKVHEAELPQPVVLMFQPAEEGPGGALPMIRDGLMKDPAVGAALMVHVDPTLPAGAVGFKSGYAMASADDFHLTVFGKGGHGAHPNRGVDALVVASQIVVLAQTLVSRMTDPAEPAVLTFGTIHGGWRENVLADKVELTGTIRTFTAERRRGMEDELWRLATHVAEASGARAELDVHHGYPPVFCHEGLTALALQVAGDILGPAQAVAIPEPSLGAEDFAYVATLVPGTNCHLGVRPPGAPASGEGVGLHSARFIADEDALPAGAAVLAGVALHGIGTIAQPARPIPADW
jgi:amidohydrolase